MGKEALRSRVGTQSGLGLGILIGSLLVAMLWLGVSVASANDAATTETRTEPIKTTSVTGIGFSR